MSGCSLFWWQVGVHCFDRKWVFFVCLFVLVASGCVLFWWQVGVLCFGGKWVFFVCFGGKWVFFVCRPYCPDITIMLKRALKPSHLSYVPVGNIPTGYSGNVPRVEEASCDSRWS